MALDIHILNAESDPPTVRSGQFEEDVHGAIFFAPCFDPRHYPLLNRMQDYNADAKYAGAELAGIVAEVSRLKTDLPSDSRIQECLAQFSLVCKRASESGQLVLCVAD